jgi:hypothetical protein
MGHFSLKNAHFPQKWTEKTKNSRLKRHNCHPPRQNRQICRPGGSQHKPTKGLKAEYYGARLCAKRQPQQYPHCCDWSATQSRSDETGHRQNSARHEGSAEIGSGK